MKKFFAYFAVVNFIAAYIGAIISFGMVGDYGAMATVMIVAAGISFAFAISD